LCYGLLKVPRAGPVTAPSRIMLTMSEGPRTITTVLFDGFELLDVFGPLEVFGAADGKFALRMIGPEAGPVTSAQGPAAVAEYSFVTAPAPDIMLIPGGRGSRRLVKDDAFLAWLADWAGGADLVTSVCTGSAVLAAAGLLDGYRATSNKRSFAWARAQGPRVDWAAQARWVHDRDRWTSSGVAAGMDMALALVADLHGDKLAREIATAVELEWHDDPAWDPFAAVYGLTSS
jgi:transcriptional regulator GlxA family with amidase domain